MVAPCNLLAVEWVDRWPDWPGRILALHGTAGAGKSHLAQVWKAQSGAHDLGSADLVGDPLALVRHEKHLLLEDVDKGLLDEGGGAHALLHLINSVRAEVGSLLMTSVLPPTRWPVALADLASRLATVQSAGLGLPDDALMEALLVKLFHDRQLVVTQEVVGFLLRRMGRSFSAARLLVDLMDRMSLSERRQITVPLAKRALEALSERQAEKES